MAIKYYCDVCHKEYRAKQISFGESPLILEWDGHTIEVIGRLLKDGYHGDLCQNCLKSALGDNLLELLKKKN